MATKYMILAEGQNELHFLREFRQYLLKPFDVKCVNVLQDELNFKIIGVKYDTVIFLFDIDVLLNSDNQKRKMLIDRLKKNIKSLNANKKYIMIQNKNFEDELVRHSQDIKTKKELYQLFGCNDSGSEFKKKFNRANNLASKDNWEIELRNMYSSYEEYLDLFSSDLQKLIKSGKFIFSKRK